MSINYNIFALLSVGDVVTIHTKQPFGPETVTMFHEMESSQFLKILTPKEKFEPFFCNQCQFEVGIEFSANEFARVFGTKLSKLTIVQTDKSGVPRKNGIARSMWRVAND